LAKSFGTIENTTNFAAKSFGNAPFKHSVRGRFWERAQNPQRGKLNKRFLGNGNSFPSNRPTTYFFWVYLLTADERSETATPTIILFTLKVAATL